MRRQKKQLWTTRDCKVEVALFFSKINVALHRIASHPTSPLRGRAWNSLDAEGLVQVTNEVDEEGRLERVEGDEGGQ